MTKPWHAIYRNWDDDALATLASAGLLRRAAKDVEAGKVDWAQPPGENGAEVRSDDQVVQVDAGGPQKARCDCPAPGICKHILAAALWLRALPADDAPARSGECAPSATSVDDANDVLVEILSLEIDKTLKEAGRAATRRAAEILSDSVDLKISNQGGNLLIEFTQPAIAVRYIRGAGLQGMVSDSNTISAASRAAWHLAALLVVWRHNGRAFDWPTGIEIAKDESDATLSEEDKQFLSQVMHLLFELCESGLSQVNQVLHEQIRAINMSARGENLPRLAAMLRGLAGTIGLLAKRDYHADEHQAIGLIARIYALCVALEHAQGDSLIALRGRLRRDFDETRHLDLLPLGAFWWENRSGARGLTTIFWETETKQTVQAVLARPDASDMAFDRLGAWSRHSLWQGVGSAERVCTGSLQLASARLSADNRIAIGGDTRAVPGNYWTADDPRWATAGYDDWSNLSEALRANTGLINEPLDSVLLRPASTMPPQLDEIRQVLNWPIVDSHGKVLMLRMPCDESHRQRIESLEHFASDGSGIKGVVAQVNRTDVRSGMLEPVALIRADGKRGLGCLSLEFAPIKEKQPSTLVGRITRLLIARRSPVAVATTSLANRLLNPIQSLAERKLMTGRIMLDEVDRDSLARYKEIANSSGLDLMAHAIDAYLVTPRTGEVLRLIYVCTTCIELDSRSFVLAK